MKKILIVLVLILSSCRAYQLQQTDKCCDTEVIYLEDVKSGTTVFSALDFKTITLDFRPSFYRSSDLYWYHNYGYMGSRPLWMDFDFHFGNYYSFYSPYYSFNRPWNYWDWYMRPWNSYQHNQWSWYNGPFNNQGYNVVYNSGRRGSTMSIKNRIRKTPFIASTKPVINNTKPRVNNTKPVWNNKPIRNNNIPVYNNNRPVINNSKPINNTRPTINNNSRSTRNNKRSISINKRKQ